MSLNLKLTAAFLAVGLAGAVLVAAFVGHRTRREFGEFVLNREQQVVATIMEAHYAARGTWDGVELALRQAPLGRRPRDFLRSRFILERMLLADAEGSVVLGGLGYAAGDSLSDADRERAVPIRVDGDTVGRVLFGGPGGPPLPSDDASAEADFLARVNRAILLGAGAAALLALALGLVLARTISRPIKALTAATAQVAQGRLGHQVPVTTSDEVGELAAAFNRMSADLADASRLRRQMTADIAHDLRTPLTVILGYTEGLVDGRFGPGADVFETIHGEAQHLQRLVDDLRTLSLADAGELNLQREATDLDALLQRAAAAQRPAADAKGVALRVVVEPRIPTASLDPQRMLQVLGNLVSNAIRHTPSRGTVTLSASPTAAGVALSVADDGEGIPAADLPHIFERHYRSDRSRSGAADASGLGLAIARSIVEAHGGTIRVESAPGSGAAFTVDLPV